MALSRTKLFFDRFLAVNLERYQANPEMLALFQGLTESEVTFENFTGVGSATRSLTAKSSSRNFIGLNQTYLAAEINSERAYTLVEAGVAADLEALAEKTVPGAYAYLDEDGTTVKILILIDDKTPTGTEANAAAEAFTSAFNYDVLPGDISSTSNTLTIEAPCFYGTVSYRLAAAEVIDVPATDYGQLEYPE